MFHFKSIKDLLKEDEQWFVNLLELVLWKGKTPVSPFDPTSKVIKCADQITKGKNPVKYTKYKCVNKGKYFNVKNKTIFERSKVELKDFFYAGYMMYVNKKGISSLQLAQDLNVQYNTAWFITHRLRKIADDPLFKVIFKYIIVEEADETLIGGKNKNRHKDKKIPHSQGRSLEDKTPVVGVIDRKTGTLIAKAVLDTTQATLEAFIRENVKERSTIYTDKHHGYNSLWKWYEHKAGKYSKKAYTNRIESAWNPFKKSYSIHHWISEKHLQRYIFQWTFRHNIRKYKNKEEKLKQVMSLVVGKRLTYRGLINGY
jgi:transposase-like protein